MSASMYVKQHGRVLAPLFLAYVAGAVPHYWASGAVFIVAQGVAIWLWSEK